jgi:hypothetical protein
MRGVSTHAGGPLAVGGGVTVTKDSTTAGRRQVPGPKRQAGPWVTAQSQASPHLALYKPAGTPLTRAPPTPLGPGAASQRFPGAAQTASSACAGRPLTQSLWHTGGRQRTAGWPCLPQLRQLRQLRLGPCRAPRRAPGPLQPLLGPRGQGRWLGAGMAMGLGVPQTHSQGHWCPQQRHHATDPMTGRWPPAGPGLAQTGPRPGPGPGAPPLPPRPLRPAPLGAWGAPSGGGWGRVEHTTTTSATRARGMPSR